MPEPEFVEISEVCPQCGNRSNQERNQCKHGKGPCDGTGFVVKEVPLPPLHLEDR